MGIKDCAGQGTDALTHMLSREYAQMAACFVLAALARRRKAAIRERKVGNKALCGIMLTLPTTSE